MARGTNEFLSLIVRQFEGSRSKGDLKDFDLFLKWLPVYTWLFGNESADKCGEVAAEKLQ